MKSIIVGGGKIGYYLLKTLKERNFQVTLIERDKEICSKIAEDIDTDIIYGDGTDLDVLKDAGIEEAEIIAAVTGNDEENLVICQIAKISFSINKTIAKINNPKNIAMFKALGVDKTVCSTEVIANLIENEFDREGYKIIQAFDRGSMVLAEISITAESLWCNQIISNLELPDEFMIISIFRGEKVIYPKSDTQILKNDRIFVITIPHNLSHLNCGGNQNGKQKK